METMHPIIDSSEKGVPYREIMVAHPLFDESSWRVYREKKHYGSFRTVFLLSLTSVFFVSCCIFLATTFFKKDEVSGMRFAYTPSEEEKHDTNQKEKPFSAVVVSARAAFVYDMRDGVVLYEKNADTPLPLASLTKLMTALVALEKLPPDALVEIPPSALMEEGDSGLFAEEQWRVRDLVSFTLMTSSNDGALALALSAFPNASSSDSAFVASMNTRSKALGFSDMSFQNPTGLDAEVGDGGVASAREVALLLQKTWQAMPLAGLDTSRAYKRYVSETGIVHDAMNTDPLVSSVAGVLFSKTGYTFRAGGNLALLFNAGLDRPIAVVVLGSSREGRFNDVSALVSATYAHFAQETN
jgi:D-alanyl-D-alanine carboxypeptidase